MTITCPHCSGEVSAVFVTYSCARGHKWAEDVERPNTPSMPITPSRDRGGIRMPFGKHKDVEIQDLESGYIRWCLENLERLDTTIRTEMENQLLLREGKGVRR